MSSSGLILAGDVGGTKTNLALFQPDGDRLTPMAERSVKSADFSGLDAIVSAFLREAQRAPARACFGVAGPVVDGRCQATNLPWVADVRSLQQTIGVEAVWLLNDLETTAYGIQALPAQALQVLQRGTPQPQGHCAVIAAGTGLGEALLVWDGQRYRAIASEGGHADFAPRSELELELSRYLLGRFGHASYERVLSGPGLANIYDFLKSTRRGQEPAWLAVELAAGDPSAAISRGALERRESICVQALALFASIYGAEAGNLALKVLARGGVYVGGGIAPKILPALTDGGFMQAFVAKGRLAPFLSEIPVHVVLEPKASLYGAARMAMQRRG